MPEELAFEGNSCELHLGNALSWFAQGETFEAMPLVVWGVPLIRISAADRHLFLDLLILENDETPLLKIVKNELVMSTDVWDIAFIGNTLTLRLASRDILCEVEFSPPGKVVVRRGFFFARGLGISLDDSGLIALNGLLHVHGMTQTGVKPVGVAMGSSVENMPAIVMRQIDTRSFVPFASLREAKAVAAEAKELDAALARGTVKRFTDYNTRLTGMIQRYRSSHGR